MACSFSTHCKCARRQAASRAAHSWCFCPRALEQRTDSASARVRGISFPRDVACPWRALTLCASLQQAGPYTSLHDRARRQVCNPLNESRPYPVPCQTLPFGLKSTGRCNPSQGPQRQGLCTKIVHTYRCENPGDEFESPNSKMQCRGYSPSGTPPAVDRPSQPAVNPPGIWSCRDDPMSDLSQIDSIPGRVFRSRMR